VKEHQRVGLAGEELDGEGTLLTDKFGLRFVFVED